MSDLDFDFFFHGFYLLFLAAVIPLSVLPPLKNKKCQESLVLLNFYIIPNVNSKESRISFLLPAWRSPLEYGALEPRTFVQPLPPPQKVLFWGAFYPFPKLLIAIFSPPPPEGKGGALCLRGWDGSPAHLRASLRIPPHPSASRGGGSPRWEPPPCPRCPLPGGRYCVRAACAVRGGGCAGLRQNNGRGGSGWEKGGKGGRTEPAQAPRPCAQRNWEPVQWLPV